MPNTLYLVFAAVVAFAGLAVWGSLEHAGRVRAGARLASVQAEVASCTRAALDQARAVAEMKQRGETLRLRAEEALRAVEAANGRLRLEHARVQRLLDAPTKETSCDSAWDALENPGLGIK